MLGRLLLALTLLSPLVPASDSATPPQVPDTQSLQPAVLVRSPSTGRQARLEARERQYLLFGGQALAVYEADIPASILASLVDSGQKWDSSRAVLVTIWMYYNQFEHAGRTYVAVSKYENRGQLYDSSVRMTNASMNAGCAGLARQEPVQCWPDTVYTTRRIGTPISGTVYRLTPPWAGHYVELYPGFQAGNSKVQLRRGPTTTWWLEICIHKGSCGL